MLTQSSYYLHWSSLVQIMANHLFSTNNDFSPMRRFQPLAAHTIEVSAEHYNDVIMSTIASQITSLTIVYSTVFSDADQRKHQTSASLAFVREIQRDRWIPRTKGQLRGKCFHLITSSWTWIKTIVATVRGAKGYAMTSMTLYEAWSLSLFGIVPSHFWKFIQQHLMEIGNKVSCNSHFFPRYSQRLFWVLQNTSISHPHKVRMAHWINDFFSTAIQIQWEAHFILM